MVDYELVDEDNGFRYKNYSLRIGLLLILYITITTVVFISWEAIYEYKLFYPVIQNDVPDWLIKRAEFYANASNIDTDISHDFRLVKAQNGKNTATTKAVIGELETTSSPIISSTETIVEPSTSQRLVCYYTSPNEEDKYPPLQLINVDAKLCTHIHIGLVEIQNCSLQLSAALLNILAHEAPLMKSENNDLKLVLWVGGGDQSAGFPEMVRNHTTRKIFIHSVKSVLQQYRLDGIDLDWEFPSAYNKERQHFSQLLYEIKAEFKREHRDYLLSVAVAAPESIAYFAYDIRELNLYADYVNLMSYDYHFYTHLTPYTGLNAPLYALENEHSILATLNINYSVNWWLTNGLLPNKLVVGLPTYGHSYTLVNAFNNRIGAPARGIGWCGSKGFTSYSELCWFKLNNVLVSTFYDHRSCSPYLSCGPEWISFENEMSITCKTEYIKSKKLGGVMVFSLNMDDYRFICKSRKANNSYFPLTKLIKQLIMKK